MKILYGIDKIKQWRKPVLAIGVFDGVHRGHRLILASAVKKAAAIGGTSMVLTFSPHPREEESLYSLAHRFNLLKELGIRVCVVVSFNTAFSRLTPRKFVDSILCGKIRPAWIYVGDNFHFGKDAKGDTVFLKHIGSSCGFGVKLFKVRRIAREPISSTRIRRLIKSGNIKAAEKLLARKVSVFGKVIKGNIRARTLGFPTANIDPHHEVTPPPGIYAVKVIISGKKFRGACYIGNNPTLRGLGVALRTKARRSIEVNIFNLHRSMYGKNIEIQFIEKIRDEMKFPSQEALQKQIRKDITFAKKVSFS